MTAGSRLLVNIHSSLHLEQVSDSTYNSLCFVCVKYDVKYEAHQFADAHEKLGSM